MSYGRNFSFRSTPQGGNRAGRYYLAGSTSLPIGVPVVLSGDADASTGRLGVQLATGSQAKPVPGKGGVLVYEHIQHIGLDPYLYTYSDFDKVPAGEPVQVINGDSVKVAFKNTTATKFLTRSSYPTARVMVANVGGATPNVAVGDFLTPGTGNDAAGYWAETATAANAWLVVTAVNASTGEVEARVNF
jgi:hypothetical protein